MNLVEKEILTKLQADIGDGFKAYYQGEAKVPPQTNLPCLMVFGNGTSVVARDTLNDTIEFSVTIRAMSNVMSSFKETGTMTNQYFKLSGVSGTFQVGEVVTGGTSHATATITSLGTNYVVTGLWTGTFAAGEVITGGTSHATATTVSFASTGLIQSQYDLRQLMEGRDPITYQYLPNTVLGCLRKRSNLLNKSYYYNHDIKITYRPMVQNEYFYVSAEMVIQAASTIIPRPQT